MFRILYSVSLTSVSLTQCIQLLTTHCSTFTKELSIRVKLTTPRGKYEVVRKLPVGWSTGPQITHGHCNVVLFASWVAQGQGWRHGSFRVRHSVVRHLGFSSWVTASCSYNNSGELMDVYQNHKYLFTKYYSKLRFPMPWRSAL